MEATPPGIYEALFTLPEEKAATEGVFESEDLKRFREEFFFKSTGEPGPSSKVTTKPTKKGATTPENGWCDSLDPEIPLDLSVQAEATTITFSDWNDVTCNMDKQRVTVPYPGRPLKDVNEDAPAGFPLDLRFEPNYAYTALEVVTWDPWFEASRPFFPTQWIHKDNPYWAPVLELPDRYWDGETMQILHPVDGCEMEVNAHPNGEVLVNRNGVTVQVAYEDGGNGGYPQPPPLSEIVPEGEPYNRKKEPCVETVGIPRGCPYWSSLLAGLVSPNYGKTKWVRSEFDEVKCLVLMEPDGRVEVRRDNKQVEILGPYQID